MEQSVSRSSSYAMLDERHTRLFGKEFHKFAIRLTKKLFVFCFFNFLIFYDNTKDSEHGSD